MIRTEAVCKHYGDTVAVERASLDVAAGEVVALLGPSGCGKTTLLRLIAGFERPDDGVVEVAGRAVAGAGAWTPPERRRVGMVFQDYALFPHLTVEENVAFGLPRAERTKRVPLLLALVDLCGHGKRYPHELSGGQQQRVALARALGPSPDAVLLDEPWSSVDSQLRVALRDEVIRLLRRLQLAVILVTHDREEAFSVADRIALMRDGTIVQEGRPEELYYEPACRWSAAFVGDANLVRGAVRDGFVHTPLGTFPANGSSGQETAEVLLRPELLELQLDPAGLAEVVGREFRGHDVHYRLLVDGVELVAQRPSNEVVPLGARVRIALHDRPAAVFH